MRIYPADPASQKVNGFPFESEGFSVDRVPCRCRRSSAIEHRVRLDVAARRFRPPTGEKKKTKENAPSAWNSYPGIRDGLLGVTIQIDMAARSRNSTQSSTLNVQRSNEPAYR